MLSHTIHLQVPRKILNIKKKDKWTPTHLGKADNRLVSSFRWFSRWFSGGFQLVSDGFQPFPQLFGKSWFSVVGWDYKMHPPPSPLPPHTYTPSPFLNKFQLESSAIFSSSSISSSFNSVFIMIIQNLPRAIFGAENLILVHQCWQCNNVFQLNEQWLYAIGSVLGN